VEDEVEGLFRLFFSDYTDPVNVGNPNEFTVRQLAEMILEETGGGSELIERPLPQDDPKVRQPDISLARAQLDWVPQTSLRDGLKKTIPYFRHLVEMEGAQARTLD
jgi:nucleoside-diphosphate-sugar epimerase